MWQLGGGGKESCGRGGIWWGWKRWWCIGDRLFGGRTCRRLHCRAVLAAVAREADGMEAAPAAEGGCGGECVSRTRPGGECLLAVEPVAEEEMAMESLQRQQYDATYR